MEVSVFWTEFARNKLKKIFSYYSEKVSLRIAESLVSCIVNSTKNLPNFPLSGTLEPLLKQIEINSLDI